MGDHYDPVGVTFFDVFSQREMKFVTEGPWEGWIVYRHPEGHWVTLRRAAEEDHERLATVIIEDEAADGD